MRLINYLLVFLCVVFLYTCHTAVKVTETPPYIRQIRPNDVIGYHSPVQMRIAWYPYRNLSVKKKANNDWTVVQNDTMSKEGFIPVILIDYLNNTDSIWLEMNTDNETLGRLIKHTLMTDEPITKPYSSYFEFASCTRCHPPEVDKGF